MRAAPTDEMLFLALHIVGNAVFLLLVRAGRGERFHYPLVGLTNYATGAVLGALSLALAFPGRIEPLAGVFGAVNGAQYLVTYVLMYVLYGLVGVSVTTSIMRLSAVVPVVASMVVWREWPNSAQAMGLLLAGIALPLLSGVGQRHGRLRAGGLSGPRAALLVLGTLLVSGCGLLAAKAFAELEQPAQRPVYVLAVYVVATLMALGVQRSKFNVQGGGQTDSGTRLRSMALGVLVGVVNIGQIWALLPALEEVSGTIAFPLSAAGGLALAVLGARVLWGERLSRQASIGIALAMAAAALTNVRT